MKNAVFWDVTPRGSCKNRRFGEAYCLHHYGEKIRELQLLVTIKVVPIAVFALMMEAMRCSETSVLTIATRRHIPEDGALQLYCSLGYRIVHINRVARGCNTAQLR
jgi:hypothetical protein